MHNHFSFSLLLFLLLVHCYYYNYYNYYFHQWLAVAVTVLAGVLSSFLLSLVVVALLKYQYHLLYQPVFLSFSYLFCCFKSKYPTTVFLRDHSVSKFQSFFVLSLPLHLTTITKIFNFNEFIFVYVINIRFICDDEIYLLTYLLTSQARSLLKPRVIFPGSDRKNSYFITALCE